MDHHCPWVQNCIGYYNYGHFVRFITWTTISTFYCAVLLILRCVEAYENEKLGLVSCEFCIIAMGCTLREMRACRHVVPAPILLSCCLLTI